MLMSSAGSVHVFVLIDALGWNLLKDRSFLPDILPYRRRLRTILGFSSGAIPTILTGLPPAATGHWNLFYYDPAGSPFRWLRPLGFLPDSILNHRVTRKILKEMGRRVLGLGPLFECCVAPRFLPYFNWVEKRNIYGYNGIETARSFFDELARAAVPHRIYSYHDCGDAEILRRAGADLARGADAVYFLYLCEMDHFLHEHREDARKIEERLAWYEVQLRQLYRTATANCSRLSFSVFSDHGMAPVRERYDLVRDVRSLGFRMPGDYLAVYDSTMARFWFFNEQARAGITAHLRESRCGRILSDQELRQHGVFFEDRRFGELIFLLEAGYMIGDGDFNGPRWDPAGMHGYHPDDADSDAAFLSNHEPSYPMETIADLHTHMRHAIASRTADFSK